MPKKSLFPLTLLLPPNDAKTGTTTGALNDLAAGPDALAAFLRDSRPWRNHPVPLAGRVTAALWSLAGFDAVVAAWLTAVVRGRSRCAGPLCATATLGDHPAVTLALALACLAVLLALAVLTRGFTRAGASHLTGIAVAGALGLLAVTGALMVLMLAAFVLALFIVVLLGITASA